jgi:hypothetical protein
MSLLQKPKDKESREERGVMWRDSIASGGSPKNETAISQIRNSGSAPFTRNCIAMTGG